MERRNLIKVVSLSMVAVAGCLDVFGSDDDIDINQSDPEAVITEYNKALYDSDFDVMEQLAHPDGPLHSSFEAASPDEKRQHERTVSDVTFESVDITIIWENDDEITKEQVIEVDDGGNMETGSSGIKLTKDDDKWLIWETYPNAYIHDVYVTGITTNKITNEFDFHLEIHGRLFDDHDIFVEISDDRGDFIKEGDFEDNIAKSTVSIENPDDPTIQIDFKTNELYSKDIRFNPDRDLELADLTVDLDQSMLDELQTDISIINSSEYPVYIDTFSILLNDEDVTPLQIPDHTIHPDETKEINLEINPLLLPELEPSDNSVTILLLTPSGSVIDELSSDLDHEIDVEIEGVEIDFDDDGWGDTNLEELSFDIVNRGNALVRINEVEVEANGESDSILISEDLDQFERIHISDVSHYLYFSYDDDTEEVAIDITVWTFEDREVASYTEEITIGGE